MNLKIFFILLKKKIRIKILIILHMTVFRIIFSFFGRIIHLSIRYQNMQKHLVMLLFNLILVHEDSMQNF